MSTMRIMDLLNEASTDSSPYTTPSPSEFSPSPLTCSTISTPSPSTTYQMLPRRKNLAKDAPVFTDGVKTVGIVNFRPHEAGIDAELAKQHRKFQIYPLNGIMKKGVRHIPYSSDKKDFLNKTGREAFEMFQYTYKVPGDEKEYVVVWDYNVGLVRITPFFKSLKYSKTVPRKAIKGNPELNDICYSITGGALVCQGYWIPYHAARALAATFCYDIRFALTPVFGNDFPSSCLAPKHTNFAKFFIPSSIISFCAAETTRFRTQGKQYRLQPADLVSTFISPKTQLRTPAWGVSARKQPHDAESGYGTDSDRNFDSPAVSPCTRQVSLARMKRTRSKAAMGLESSEQQAKTETAMMYPPDVVEAASILMALRAHDRPSPPAKRFRSKA